MGWWNEPFQKWDFKFRGRSWKKYPLQLPSWAHNWNLRRMNFMKMPEKKDFSSQLLPQLASDYPPPIWSLSSPHLIIGYRWICRISFHIFHHICSKWQCSEPHIMYYTIFGSGFSTHLPLGVNQASLQIKGAQDPGLWITTLVQFCKFSSHWRMNDGSNLSSHWSKKCSVLSFCACFTRQCYLYRHDVHHSWLVI